MRSALAIALFVAPLATPAAASPHLQISRDSIAATNSATRTSKPGLFDLGDVHLLFFPSSSAEGRPVPLLLLLHGSGGTAASLLKRFNREAERHGIALLGVKSRDGTWDMIATRTSGRTGRSGDFASDAPRIEAALGRSLERVRVDPARIGIGGFSDGASYALSVGTANPQLFSSVLAFSPGMAELRAPHESRRTNGPQRIFVSHGRGDPILSYSYTARRIVPPLRRLGVVTFRAFDGSHEIPADIGAEALSFFLGGDNQSSSSS